MSIRLSRGASIWDTQAVIERVAGREVELGIVGALRRNCSLVFEPLARDEIVLAVPPGHPAAGREFSVDDRRGDARRHAGRGRRAAGRRGGAADAPACGSAAWSRAWSSGCRSR